MVSGVLRQRSCVAFSNVRTNPVLVHCILATIKCYLLTVQHFKICHGYSNTYSLPRLELVLRGIKKLKGVAISPGRLPVTHNVTSPLVSKGFRFRRGNAMGCLLAGFFAFLRAGEFAVHLEQPMISRFTCPSRMS